VLEQKSAPVVYLADFVVDNLKSQFIWGYKLDAYIIEEWKWDEVQAKRAQEVGSKVKSPFGCPTKLCKKRPIQT
jgi:hypothetical protein